MTKEELIDRINDIEWEDFEAKEAKSELPKNIWETVSAFANTSGGWIVLGVKQNGKKFEISGVDNAEKLEQDFLGTLRSQKVNEAVDAKSMLYHIDGHRFFWMDLVEIPGRSVREARTRYTYRIPEQENLWEYFQIMIRRLRLIVDTPFMMNDEGFNVEDRSQFKILREALVNMLSHFDPFSTIHSCIHIYTDRVEFFNAGGYPVPISQLGNHLYSNPRNPIIAKIFRLVNLSETIGYGFDMMNEWKEITGNDVTFESDICTSTVTFWLDSDRASNRASNRAEEDTYIDATDKLYPFSNFAKTRNSEKIYSSYSVLLINQRTSRPSSSLCYFMIIWNLRYQTSRQVLSSNTERPKRVCCSWRQYKQYDSVAFLVLNDRVNDIVNDRVSNY
jgi:predicted HTH transcriptional regulator